MRHEPFVMLNQTPRTQSMDRRENAVARWRGALFALAGVLGAWGVGAAALAAHGEGGPDLLIASRFLMIHAAAVCALAGFGGSRRLGFLAAASILAPGALLFCGDLSCRALIGTRLFPMAAPIGGSLMILGWLVVAFAGLRDAIAPKAML